ncbi:MAG: DEAD/DEAH box helicase family protein [Candidatus Moeniiplasma glomeromycotorum]|nr:DEAD/DEAH box helicase family protein [Candidatus Moeniiplasma glomeromycotorum]MCE8162248.1 DEAD/DEAH box helicase family protein [Candidatus Moeniiplasma glomeromycotorum]MCE8166096.1 DEAD/DEAH box helicase family protein [Candidatus Moeniiplasma glomeromycotorum]MCE8166647.1 DEAD/DEAH box helicase family protein [Candidatus Moeniiplasma glomeromycotorum]
MKLHGYQIRASQELTNRYIDYQSNPNKPKNKKGETIPIILTLASITGSGKTAILAKTVNNIFDHYVKVKPIVFWLGYSKVIVEQTLNKLGDKESGYKSLVLTAEVKSFININSRDIEEINIPLIYVDTVQKFNARSEKDRRIYQIEEDKEGQSKWNLIVNRITSQGIKRPLVIVYDEGHHLSNQQVDKILELNPQGMILASGTPSYSVILSSYIKKLKELKYKLEIHVSVQAVTKEQMVKSAIALGGYNSPMEVMVNEVLQDLRKLEKLTQIYNIKRPKVIYVCKTNVLEVGHFEKDKVELPFEQRKAPPILIWKHLRSQGVPADDIVVYADIEVSKDEKYSLKEDFKKNLFGKNGAKENTYEKFIGSDFQHIIFNRSLAEGWDNPYVYIAYIDKTIGSEVAVEQIIGRVLRQPNCRYYQSEELNKAYFHIRVDEDKVFHKIIDELRSRLGKEGSSIKVREEKLIDKIEIPLKLGKIRKVPFLSWETGHIEERLQNIVNNIPDYSDRKKYSDEYIRNIGTRQWTEYKLDDHNITEIRQEDFSYTNQVRARVVLQRAIIDRNSKVWELVENWVAKFDALIGWGSDADEELRKYANELVDIYLKEVFLKVRINQPYEVGNIKVERDKTKCHNFKNALHSKYSNLNGLEIKTASALDSLGKDWCRNPHFSGYGIELIDESSTATFYPDFLLWLNNDTVICLEVTSKWLEEDKLKRKLVRIHEPEVEMINEAPRKVYVIIIIQYGNPLKGEEFSYKVWYRKRIFEEIASIEVKNIGEALRVMLSDCL